MSLDILPKFYRLRTKNDTGESLVFDNAARISVTILPWKLVSGSVVYGTAIVDDFGFGSGDTIVDLAEAEITAVDNTTNLFWGVTGTFNILTDNGVADGTFPLYLEYSDDNSNWPSDKDDFVITDLTLIKTLPVQNSGSDKTRAVNFKF